MQGVVFENRDEAPRAKHPRHVADGHDRVRERVEALGAPHEIERIVWKGQPVERAGDELDPRTSPLARRLHLGFGEVGQIDVRTSDEPSRTQPLRDAPSVEPVAAGEVEHAHVGIEWQFIHDCLQLNPEGPVKP